MADETAMTAAEKKRAEEAKIDAAVAERLRCQGCGNPLLPVPHRSYVQWTCPVPGCSRMLPPSAVGGWVRAIVATVAGVVDTDGKARAAVRRYERKLGKAK